MNSKRKRKRNSIHSLYKGIQNVIRYSHSNSSSSYKPYVSVFCKIVLAQLLCIMNVLSLSAFGFSDAIAEEGTQIQHVNRMQLTFTIEGNEITAYYTGALFQNRPYGEGIYVFEDKHGPWSFIGTLDNGAFANGEVIDYPYTMSFSDEDSYSTYTGLFIDGQPYGEGTYTIVTSANTTTLEGHYDDQKRFSGNATNLSKSLSYNGVIFSGSYTGAYVNGQADGNGSFESEGPLFFKYNGVWSQDGIIGPGYLHTNNAQISLNGSTARAEYSGKIDDGCFNGDGTITINREDAKYVYSGNWLNNVYDGKGTLTVTKAGGIGYTYEGEWKDGLYNGEGALVYDSDDIIKYIGNFENGRFRPTFVQLINSLCSAENSKLTLAEYVQKNIESRQLDFIKHFVVDVNSLFSYEKFAQEQNEENSANFSVSLKVLQIRQYDEDVFGYPVTEFIGSDKNDLIYYGYYIGYFDGINTGDQAEVIAYPLGYSSYKSQDGGDIPALRFIAYQVK